VQYNLARNSVGNHQWTSVLLALECQVHTRHPSHIDLVATIARGDCQSPYARHSGCIGVCELGHPRASSDACSVAVLRRANPTGLRDSVARHREQRLGQQVSISSTDSHTLSLSLSHMYVRVCVRVRVRYSTNNITNVVEVEFIGSGFK
jgi:hypothetical protein